MKDELPENEQSRTVEGLSGKNGLLAVLTGQSKPTDEQRLQLLRVATMCGVCGLYEYYKEDVLAKFSIGELKNIVETTEQFQGFTVEHIYHTALYS